MTKHFFMPHNRFLLRSLSFTGPQVEEEVLNFEPATNLIYGASNTGKSLTLKSIDFMLGGSKKLPKIEEIKGYDTVWLSFEVTGQNYKAYTLSRHISGGKYTLYNGLKNFEPIEMVKFLEDKHDSSNNDNLSNFLLENIGLNGRRIVKNQSGEKVSLSFRDLAHINIVDEKSIQDEISPIEGGQTQNRTKERRAFRSLISGEDDSEIIETISPQKFKASKEGKLEIINELVTELENSLKNNKYVQEDALRESIKETETTIHKLNLKLDAAQKPVNLLIKRKATITKALNKSENRKEQVAIHLKRFEKLNEVYDSDIQRLLSIEEAGFLLSTTGDRECPLCGADAENQVHEHSISEIEGTREASREEIAKIKKLKKDLNETTESLEKELKRVNERIKRLNNILLLITKRIVHHTPTLQNIREHLSKLFNDIQKDKKSLDIIERKKSLEFKRDKIQKETTSKNDKPNLKPIQENKEREFCNYVSHVLNEWGFPGNHEVTFDSEYYDIIIDGKLRTDNGKGVRAVTHAAFKVALLIYCRENNLPHPGFLILDTPLLTYRDPLKSKHGDLEDDEKSLAKSQLKDKFFKHLNSLRNIGQFIILENIDPPNSLTETAKLYEFTGDKEGGRYGLFPSKK